MIESRRSKLRWMFYILIVHSVLIFSLSVLHNVYWDSISFAPEAGRFIRVIDWPVAWIVDQILRQITELPVWWPIGFRWTPVVIETSLFSLLGGSFYGVIAFAVSFVMRYRRRV